MAQVTRAASKLKFETGDIPTQADFEDLHDSVKWYDEGVSDGDKGDIIVSGSGSVWTLEDAFKRDNALNILNGLGSTIVAEPYNNIASLTQSGTLTSQQVRITAVWVDKSRTITGVKWNQSQTGNYTASNYNGVGLYTYSGGTLTLVASSTDDGNIWKGSLWQSKAFSTPYVAAPGVYFAACLYSQSAQTTPPGISCSANINPLLIVDLPNSAKLHGILNTQTSLPASVAISSFSANGAMLYLALY